MCKVIFLTLSILFLLTLSPRESMSLPNCADLYEPDTSQMSCIYEGKVYDTFEDFCTFMSKLGEEC